MSWADFSGSECELKAELEFLFVNYKRAIASVFRDKFNGMVFDKWCQLYMIIDKCLYQRMLDYFQTRTLIGVGRGVMNREHVVCVLSYIQKKWYAERCAWERKFALAHIKLVLGTELHDAIQRHVYGL